MIIKLANHAKKIIATEIKSKNIQGIDVSLAGAHLPILSTEMTGNPTSTDRGAPGLAHTLDHRLGEEKTSASVTSEMMTTGVKGITSDETVDEGVTTKSDTTVTVLAAVCRLSSAKIELSDSSSLQKIIFEVFDADLLESVMLPF